MSKRLNTSATTAFLQKSAQRLEPLPEDFPIGKLRKLTQVQDLVVIAKHNNRVVRAKEAKQLLIKAGVLRETKNSTTIIHAAIVRSDKFERISKGEHRLKGHAPLPMHPMQEAAQTAGMPFVAPLKPQ